MLVCCCSIPAINGSCGGCPRYAEYMRQQRAQMNMHENPFRQKPVSTGWICPKCGKANAPTKETCDCNSKTLEWTVSVPTVWVDYGNGTASVRYTTESSTETDTKKEEEK